MSSSNTIPIPKRKKPQPSTPPHTSSPGNYSYASSSSSSTPSTYSHAESSLSASYTPSTVTTSSPARQHSYDRRPSLLGASLSKSEHTVINIGGPENPRLITCVKTSQGFDWNLDIFLPSYASDHDSSELERKQDPVDEIVLTDEEAAAIFPR
ncbi:hypothetical protein EV356DRAFT_505354 [Viridothelium virens]|uniref:Uncharacterized protein n=1 Tax=Viridothelium virens TaxID=1048519 RepID=A0A6A6H3W5_VIRVR|nr:hypothetical protein EV356DRAFT_505354 [Viridothelium virens]